MYNVYQQIDLFYEKNIETADIIDHSLIENYFRRLSWKGNDNKALQQKWQMLQGLLNYMLLERLKDFNSLYKYDFVQSFKMTVADNKSISADEKHVTIFFDVIKNFFHFVEGKYDLAEALYTGLENAQKMFIEEGKFRLPKITEDDLAYDTANLMDDFEEDILIDPEEAERLNKILEKLMSGVAEYYRGKEYWSDLNRAMAMFLGPVEEPPTQDDVSFWLGFWDFFFFDYHLIGNDQTPIENFYYQEYDNLLLTERTIIKSLLSAEFRIFTIDSIQGDYLSVSDLFSDEHTVMPCPEFINAEYKNKILYGHVNIAGAIMMSNITAVPASEKLQRRIKEEINRSFAVYKKYQASSADIGIFFGRHAGAIRHIINILAGFAQLKVVSFIEQIPALKPKAGYKEKILPFYRQEIISLAMKVGYSTYCAQLIGKLYDECSELGTIEQKESTAKEFAAAIFSVFSFINEMDITPLNQIMKMLAVDLQLVEKMSEDIKQALGCVKGDPRYLSEEGFIHLLYSNLN